MQIDASDLLLQRAFRWERERPTRVYLTQPLGGGKVRDYTWAEAMDEARRMAAYLEAQGFPPGSSIALLSKNCAQFIIADLAIWMAGHVSVALYPTLAADTVRYILDHADAKLVFVGKLDEWESMKSGIPATTPRIAWQLSPADARASSASWEEIVAKTAPLTGERTRGADETAVLMYTSGSTGKPKGVVHTFRSIAAGAKGADQVIRWTPDDRMLSYLPLAHAFERMVIQATSLRNCLRIYFAEALDTFVDDVRRARPTIFHSVPRLWLKFHHGVLKKMPQKKLGILLRIPILRGVVKKKILAGLGLDACRLAVSGSAPISPELIQWYRDLGLELLEGYGMSENYSYSHLSRPGNARVGYVGSVMPEVECRLAEGGEVLVKSPASMTGYYKEEAETAASFTPDGFLKTGDRGEIDAQGRLKITGRVKELFKTSKGKYVAPTPIENLVNNDPHVEQSCVSGANHTQPFVLVQLAEDLRNRLAATPSGRAEVERALTALRPQVNAQLDPHEHLAFIVVIAEPWSIANGCITPSLKIRRAAIEARHAPSVDGWYASKKSVIWE